jgi:quercetin dioxygenase-like cupin family protein
MGDQISELRRRSFIQLTLSALPASVLAQGTGNASEAKVSLVAAGTDREGKKHSIGVSSTTYKVLTQETAGASFVMEQLNHKKGGPTRHLHYSQDELFYVMDGEYVIEIGSERFTLKAGDCVLGPRGIPHAWAFVGDATGRMLISFTPAGRMEAFFNDREKLGIKPGTYSSTPAEAAALEEYGMELVGPPIKLN